MYTEFSGSYQDIYYILNPLDNSQIISRGFESNVKVQFLNNKKIFYCYGINKVNEYGNILSTRYNLKYSYYDDDYTSITLFDCKDDPKNLTYYPYLKKITCIINSDEDNREKIIAVHNSENGNSVFIRERGDVNVVQLSPSGNILLYYEELSQSFIMRNLMENQSYSINYLSHLEEWLDDYSVLLRNDVENSFRIYNLKNYSYVEFSFKDLQDNALIIGYSQQ
jgi:hypothetical protein